MITLLTALLFALINRDRGIGWIPRVEAGIMWGMTAALAAAALQYTIWYQFAILLVVIPGMMIWAIPGWGKYFASFEWTWKVNEIEIPWIDWIVIRLVPFLTEAPHWTNGLRGTLAMSLRGLYITPLFLMLSELSLGIVVGLLQGPVYAITRWLPIKGTKAAEPLYALIIGTAVAYKLAKGF